MIILRKLQLKRFRSPENVFDFEINTLIKALYNYIMHKKYRIKKHIYLLSLVFISFLTSFYYIVLK